MEYLSRILTVVGQQSDFKFHPLCSHLKLNHLLFADDLLLFAKGNASSIMWILRAFATFSAASGLQLNKDKSEIYFNGVQHNTQQDILQVSGNFLWGGNDLYLRAPAIHWDQCCRSKSEGGLGFKATKVWNKAILGKYIWWIANKKDHLWVKWINHVYMKGTHWTIYTPPTDCSWTWKKIAHLMGIFRSAYVNDKWNGTIKDYSVQEGYRWLRPSLPQVHWWRELMRAIFTFSLIALLAPDVFTFCSHILVFTLIPGSLLSGYSSRAAM
ncbi:uncharacterized protein LOC141631929 [Silene latifolia]|uniref:uncharacterized protein LOC141631929 n=1 Tax=Silene latifolia TaxID=37657 RepID=UPI003D77E045